MKFEEDRALSPKSPRITEKLIKSEYEEKKD